VTKQSADIDQLVRQAVFGTADEKERARWQIWEMGQHAGVRPASIHDLYLARGRGEVPAFTTPAMNVRVLSYDTGRAIFRGAKRLDVGAVICEIARSEIAYTDQRPAEYVAVMTAAALREGFTGPLFIQGDHVQVNAKKYAADAEAELGALRALIEEELHAGFYNIDVDTSTLVDLSKPNLNEQQRTNYEQAVDIAMVIRDIQPPGVQISIGGEIGEVGTQNSTVEELRTYMDGFNATLKKRAPGVEGLSKISVQSGTSHGGVVLPDGKIADVKIDFETLKTLSKVARDEYHLSGAVQHGASTLPDGAFNHFPRTETAEIHLATNFQTMLYDSLPADLRTEIYGWLRDNAKDERKPSDTDEQFYYKTRKKALGPFKRRFWDLPADAKATLSQAYGEKFTFLFKQLAVNDTAEVIARFVKPVEIHRPKPHPDLAGVEAAPDDADLSD